VFILTPYPLRERGRNQNLTKPGEILKKSSEKVSKETNCYPRKSEEGKKTEF